MKCPNCGESIDKNSKFCEKCGKKIEKEKTTKESKDNSKNKQKKKLNKKKLDKKKKIIIIASLIVVLLIVSIITFICINQKKQTKKKEIEIKEDWGKKYYNYLKSIDKKDKYDDAGIPKDTKNIELGFYKIDDIKKPIMIINYEKDREDYSNIYYIKNNKVNSVITEQPADVRLLYDIGKEDYVWFLHIPNGNEEKDKDLYKNLTSLIENTEEVKDADYAIGSDDTTYQENTDGTYIELSKYDETFVNPKISSWRFDISLKKLNMLKKSIINSIKNINKEKTLVKDYVEKQVEEKLKELKETKEKMETAKAELEKKQEQERLEKEKQEEMEQESQKQVTTPQKEESPFLKEKYIQTQNYRVKYGTYTAFWEGIHIILYNTGSFRMFGNEPTDGPVDFTVQGNQIIGTDGHVFDVVGDSVLRYNGVDVNIQAVASASR